MSNVAASVNPTYQWLFRSICGFLASETDPEREPEQKRKWEAPRIVSFILD